MYVFQRTNFLVVFIYQQKSFRMKKKYLVGEHFVYLKINKNWKLHWLFIWYFHSTEMKKATCKRIKIVIFWKRVVDESLLIKFWQLKHIISNTCELEKQWCYISPYSTRKKPFFLQPVGIDEGEERKLMSSTKKHNLKIFIFCPTGILSYECCLTYIYSSLWATEIEYWIPKSGLFVHQEGQITWLHRL